MWDGVIETRDFVKHTIQNARFRKTHTRRNTTNFANKTAKAVLFAFNVGFSFSQKVLRHFLGALNAFAVFSDSKDKELYFVIIVRNTALSCCFLKNAFLLPPDNLLF